MASEEENKPNTPPAQDGAQPSNKESGAGQPVGNVDGVGGQVIDSIMGKIDDPDSAPEQGVVPIADSNDFVWPDEKAIFNPLCSDGVPEVPEAGDSVYKSIFTEI